MPASLYDSLLERLDGHLYSNYFSAWCPFDSHKTPALLVFDDGLAKCLSCNKVWNHKQIDKKIGSHYIPQQNDTVSKVLPTWRTWERKYDDLDGIVYAAHQSLKRHTQFQTYFKRRKIDGFIEEGNLGLLDGWAVFPVYDSKHRIVDCVVRKVGEGHGIRYTVYPLVVGIHSLYVPAWEEVLKNRQIYVVYGIVDAIALHLAGLPVVTGTTGKSLNPELLIPMRKRFIIVPDESEEKEAHVLANKLGWRAKVKKIDYSKYENTKDPDGIRRYFGDQTLLQALS